MSDLRQKEAEASTALAEALLRANAYQAVLRSACNTHALVVAQAGASASSAEQQATLVRLTNISTAIQRLTEAQMWLERKT